MLRQLRAALVFVVLATAVCGFAYPLVVTGAAAPFDRAEVGRDYGPDLFKTRPSVTGRDPEATFFNNLGPNQQDLADQLEGYVERYLRREGRFTPGLEAADIPSDAVTTSASGVDPDISFDNAEIQANRVAARTGVPLEQVMALVEDARRHGEAVHVPSLNRAVEEAR